MYIDSVFNEMLAMMHLLHFHPSFTSVCSAKGFPCYGKPSVRITKSYLGGANYNNELVLLSSAKQTLLLNAKDLI